jgi:hypothetical protein
MLDMSKKNGAGPPRAGSAAAAGGRARQHAADAGDTGAAQAAHEINNTDAATRAGCPVLP